MKILQLVPYFFPALSVGGSATAVYNLSRELVKHGHEVIVFTTDLGSDTDSIKAQTNKKIRIEGFGVYYFKNISGNLAFKKHIFSPPAFFLKLIRTISDFDIIHMHEIYTPMHLWAAFWAKKKGIPYILSGHGTAKMSEKEGNLGRKKLFYQFGGKKLLLGAAKIIALTEEEKKSYLKLGINKKNVIVIPNGIDANLFLKLPKKVEFRSQWGLKENDCVILFLGRIHPKKGIELLIKSLLYIHYKKDNIKLVIAGPAEKKEYLDDLKMTTRSNGLEKAVIFAGNLTGRAKLAALSAAHVFALTSYAEGMPISALEAAACNLPLLLSDKSGFDRIIEYDAGKIVDNNAKKIAQGLEEILKRENFRSYFGRNANRMVKNEYSIDKIVERTEDVYKEII